MRFIESIRLESGEICNLELHQRRMELTLLAHYGAQVKISLAAELTHRALPVHGLFKIRVTYERTITDIDIEPYTRRAVERIELVEAPKIDYRFKYADRSALDALRARVGFGAQPVITQDGLVTDALYANVCFFDSVEARWVTPVRPLLLGIARELALRSGEVVAAEVRAGDVLAGRYAAVKLINCMNWFAEAQDVPCKAVPWRA